MLPLVQIYFAVVAIFATTVGLIALTYTGKDDTSKRTLKKFPVQPFQSWDRNVRTFPCVTDEYSNDGLIYIRIPRTSAKPAFVSMSIVDEEAKNVGLPEGEVCKLNDAIGPMSAYQQQVSNRNRDKSYMWSMVRDPSKRAISHFNLRLQREEVVATEESFVYDLETSASYGSNIELRSLYTSKFPADVTPDQYQDLILDTLADYNFIGVQERMNESLVALSMLIGVDVSQVVYKFSRCLVDKPRWVTQSMESYFDSPDWKSKQEADYLFYDAVNRALDLTILKLGKNEFYSRLETFEALLNAWSREASKIKGAEGCGRLSAGKIGTVEGLLKSISQEDEE